MSDLDRLRAFLDGWDSGVDNLLTSLGYIPDDQLVDVVRTMTARRQTEPSR